MNRKDSPCNEDSSYDFQLCVRNSFNRRVGCKLPWGLVSSEPVPACSNISQLGQFHILYRAIQHRDMEHIAKETGCLKPCHYKEYNLVKRRLEAAKMFVGLYVQFSNNWVTLETELETYGLVSLVSDIGGSMGLFLGFSFIMVWQVIEAGIIRIKP